MENYIDTEKVYVLDKDEMLIAVFDKEDENTIINPRVQETQNAEAVFTFYISPNNAKWLEINNPENLYVVDNKVFSTNFEGCFTETISENNEDLILVTAYERQKLLSRKYVKAWNSETGFEAIDTFMVVVLSNGDLPLKNDGLEVETLHLPGTSGYVLDALLARTGWTTGDCDVEGTFDFETDQIDIYENILKVQQIWGGILVFDSVNKIVHHRDETKYLPYDGYEVKYQKNMQSLEKLYNNKIITRLCPLGEGGLNIKSVNNGSEWLIDKSYTTSDLEGIENNPDIYDAEQLKRWGERKLKDLCKPRKELTVNAVLLRQVEGYEEEKIGLNDIVDVINYANIDNDIEQLRVVGYDHGIWDYSDAILELSDITLESTDIFKKSVQATNSINDGTLNASKVVSFFKNGQTIDESFKQLLETLTTQYTTLEKTDEMIGASATKITDKYDPVAKEVENQEKRIGDVELSIKGLDVSTITKGGNNLLRNSGGFFNYIDSNHNTRLEYWEGISDTSTADEVQLNNISKTAIYLQNATINQIVRNLKNGKYNISFNYKKLNANATVTAKIGDNSRELTETNWTAFEEVVEITDNVFNISFTSNTNNSCYIGDLLLIYGEYKQTWTQNANETQTDNVQIGEGIQVNSNKMKTYTRIDADGNRTFNSDTGAVVMAATDKGVTSNYFGPLVDSNGNKIQNNSGEFGGILIQRIDNQTWISSVI